MFSFTSLDALSIVAEYEGTKELVGTVRRMSDKEAKLAAARKRAEALKAKKAAEKVDSAKPTDNEVVNSESSPEDDDGQAEKGVIDGEGPSSDHEELKKEIGRLQNLLDESVCAYQVMMVTQN